LLLCVAFPGALQKKRNFQPTIFLQGYRKANGGYDANELLLKIFYFFLVNQLADICS
jgi:hypothetical protein